MTPAGPDPVRVGTRAPDFTSRNQYGEPLGLAELAGAPALLVFYPYAFTGICTGELRAVQDLLPRFTEAGARVLAVSCDSMFALRVFAEQERFGFDLVTDHWPHGELARRFGVFDERSGCALRGSFVLDAEGTVRWSVVNAIGDARDMAAHVVAVAGIAA